MRKELGSKQRGWVHTVHVGCLVLRPALQGPQALPIGVAQVLKR